MKEIIKEDRPVRQDDSIESHNDKVLNVMLVMLVIIAILFIVGLVASSRHGGAFNQF